MTASEAKKLAKDVMDEKKAQIERQKRAQDELKTIWVRDNLQRWLEVCYKKIEENARNAFLVASISMPATDDKGMALGWALAAELRNEGYNCDLRRVRADHDDFYGDEIILTIQWS